MSLRFRLLIPLLLVALSAHAATHAAATCNSSDVQSAINASSNGDTVTVPAGTCTWTSTVTLSAKGVSIIGVGTSTVITDNAGGNPLFNITISGTQFARVSSMKIQPQSGATNLVSPLIVVGTCSSSTCPNLRVDNIAFAGWSIAPTQIYNGWLILADNVFGVIDHNVVTQAAGGSNNGGALINISHSAYLGVGQYGDNSWTQADTFGTNNALYIESNTLTGNTGGMALTDCDHSDNFEDIGGCRFVARFNTLNDAFVQTHGTESTQRPRGARQFEVYNNTFHCTNTSQGCDTGSQARSGVALNFGNTYTTASGTWFNSMLELNDYRTFAGFPPWGYCAGQGPYDQNGGTVYATGTITSVVNNSGTLVITDSTKSWTTNQWVFFGNPYSIVDVSQSSGGTNVGWEITASGTNSVSAGAYGQDYFNGPPTVSPGDTYQILRAQYCIDQPSRHGSVLLSGSTPAPTGWVGETLDPSYEFNDTVSPGSALLHGNVATNTSKLIANRDYYSQGSSFTGATGTGSGLLASRPSTCTTGVGYWATDQGSWNSSGSGGQGQLFICSAANTWTLDYTPYTYPHPLTQAPATGPPALGQNCTNGCGIGTHILPNTLTVTLCDTANPGCASSIPAQKTVSDYPTLPLTIDSRKMNFDWDTDVAANGFVVCGSELNNSDRIQFDVTGTTYNIGTHHHVTVQHLVPASHGGNGGGGMTCYVGDNINATSSDPQQRYATGINTWPGPQCYAGSTNCYLNFFPPNPTAAQLQWEATPAGIVKATRGYPAQIPLYLLWNGGNATSVAGLGSCTVPNQMGHTYASGQWAAPNSGTWYKCVPPNWTSMGSQLPYFAATVNQITDPSSHTFNCPGSANGGESASGIPRVPADTCTGGSGDSHISVTPFYTGVYVGSSPQTDYRQIRYSTALGAYNFDANGASPPSNAVPTSSVQFFPASNAATGNYTGTITLTFYTDSTLTTPAAGTSPIVYNYAINVSDDTPIPQVDPGSYPVDTNLPSWMNYLSQQSVGMCSDKTGGTGDAMDYYNLNLQYWMWLTFGAGDWGPYNTGNYDNSRVFEAAGDQFLHQMNGSAWPNWAVTTAYGSSQATMEVTPSTDPNGNTWVASTSCTSGGSAPSWSSIPSPSPNTLLTDGTCHWRNVGTQAYWNRCTENASVPFDNQVIQANGSALWAQFTGAEEMHRQRTGDAVLKGTTTYQGFYSAAEKAQINSDFGSGLWSQYSPAAGRGTAYQLMALATYWKTVCDAGNCAAFTNSDQLKRMAFWDINASIGFLQIHQLSNDLSTDPTKTYWPTFDPLHTGVINEALREWMIRDKELDSSNSLNLADPRIIPEMTTFNDFAYFHWYNQCRVQGEGTDNWSMSYNPMDAQQCKYSGQNGINEPYFTELVGPGATSFPFLMRWNGNALMSDGTTHWSDASDIVLKHVYDGRNCSNPQGQWYCQSYSAPYAGGSGVPKTFGQVAKEEMGNAYQYRTGAYTPFEDDLSPQNNPCWTGGSVPCSSPTPFPDTTAPYGAQLHANGTEQDDPTCEAHYTGDAACSPIINIAANTATFRINIYEPTSSFRVDYGTDSTCSAGSSSTEASGYPRQINSSNQLFAHQVLLTGLTPNTTYYARYCAGDLAGNQSCNTCAALSGGFRGGKINFLTPNQTLLTILTSSLPGAAVGTAYSQTLQGAGGTPPYLWSISSGTLPDGLILNTSTGNISGVPTTGELSNFQVSLSDHVGNNAGPVALSINVTDLTVTTSSLPAGTFNVPYSATLAASGGTTPYTWTYLLGILPAGLSLDSSTGIISGTPTACVTSTPTWKVTDHDGVFASKPLLITIGGCTGSLTLTCPTYPGGVINTLYPTQSCSIIGGVSPYTCSISSGTLPLGLAIGTSGSTCTISGTPTATGQQSFNVHVHDSTGTPLTADSPGSITIIAPGQDGVSWNGSNVGVGSFSMGTPPAPPPPGPPGP